MGRIIPSQAFELIKRFEGCRLKSYTCSAGVWTIGYGRTGGIKPGQTITQATADLWLAEDIVKYAAGVDNCVKVPLNDNQYAALISFCYNVGAGALAKSTLMRRLNMRDYLGAADEFLKWTRARGKELPGLVRRRKTERELFLKS